MSCNACITIYNNIPEGMVPIKGRNFACYSKFTQPFSTPFVYGPLAPKTFFHVPISTTNTCGSFSGADGDFLIHNPSSFMVFQPKKDITITYGNVLFPTPDTHTLHVTTFPTTMKISAGSIIVGMRREGAEPNPMKTFSLFLNVNEQSDTVEKLEKYFCDCAFFFNSMWTNKLGKDPNQNFTTADFRINPFYLTGILTQPMIVGNSPAGPAALTSRAPSNTMKPATTKPANHDGGNAKLTGESAAGNSMSAGGSVVGESATKRMKPAV